MSQTENNETNYQQVVASFGPNAVHYSQSQGHNNAAVLAELVQKVAPKATDRVLDIGTGAGHTAIAFAPHVAEVVALDLTPQMLEETRRNAAEKGLTNLVTQQGPAETLPFDEATFDLVVCRLTTHHFTNIRQAVGEMARVLKPGGRVVIVDTTVPADSELDRQINEIELLRDPSHIRNYPEAEWRAFLEAQGLEVLQVENSHYIEEKSNGKMHFDKWTRRIGTSPENVARLQTLFRTASPALAQTLLLETTETEIWFTFPLIFVMARKS